MNGVVHLYHSPVPLSHTEKESLTQSAPLPLPLTVPSVWCHINVTCMDERMESSSHNCSIKSVFDVVLIQHEFASLVVLMALMLCVRLVCFAFLSSLLFMNSFARTNIRVTVLQAL